MYINLFDRGDRLGSNTISYISQILYAHKNNYFIRFTKNKEEYRYHNSIFVKTLFNYIEIYNEELIKNNILNDDNFIFFGSCHDLVVTTNSSIQNINVDLITYFNDNIYEQIETNFKNMILPYNYNIPFDVNKTILVHLRLEDVANHSDYDGSICSNYYRNKVENKEYCDCGIFLGDKINKQSPLSKLKLENIINKAKEEFNNHKVILVTSPGSDTSFLDYEVIKNEDENLDLYLLTMCNVVILSRSTFSLTSLFFNNKKIKTYVPLWGHFICCGLDTIYDKNDKSKIEYFV